MRKLLKVISVSIFTLVLVFSLHSKSFAEDSATGTNSSPTPTLRLRQEIRQGVKNDIKDKFADKASSNSSTFKQRACEEHVKVIKIRQLNIATHALLMQKRFDSISAAVQKYYAEKLVPAGKIVSNYDALVADVNTKKAALSPLIDKVKADSTGLSCDKDQQRTQFQTFKTDWQVLLKGLGVYRQSVINLVKAVKGVVKEEDSSASSSAAPEAEQ